MPFGSLLITDGLMQSSEVDEYVYHQSLVHPALTAHPNPKKVFIAGGGEVRFLRFHFSDCFCSARILQSCGMMRC